VPRKQPRPTRATSNVSTRDRVTVTTAAAVIKSNDPGQKPAGQLLLQGHHRNRHMSPDFELFKIGHNVGVIYNGKPDVGAVTDISFRSAGGRQPAFTPATRSVTYTVRLVTGESVTRSAEQVYHLPADKVEAAAIAGNVEAKRQKLHHGQRVKQQQQETAAAHLPDPRLQKHVTFNLSGEEGQGQVDDVDEGVEDNSATKVQDVAPAGAEIDDISRTTPIGAARPHGDIPPSAPLVPTTDAKPRTDGGKTKSLQQLQKEFVALGGSPVDLNAISFRQLRNLHYDYENASARYLREQLTHIGAPDCDIAAAQTADTAPEQIDILRTMLVFKYTDDGAPAQLMHYGSGIAIGGCVDNMSSPDCSSRSNTVQRLLSRTARSDSLRSSVARWVIDSSLAAS
jgi:hypothetical protein